MSSSECLQSPFVVVGGGIAGVSCAEALALLQPQQGVLLLTASPFIKVATNVQPVTKYLVRFEVEEQAAVSLSERCPTVRVLQDAVVGLHPALAGAKGGGVVVTAAGRRITYGRLCVCTGARPNSIQEDHPLVVTLRDTESVRELQARVRAARRVLVVGNGGIASELVHEVRDVEVVWVVRHDHISAAFVDAGAAEFLIPAATEGEPAHGAEDGDVNVPVVRRMRFTEAGVSSSTTSVSGGAALGPDWHTSWQLRGREHGQGRPLRLEYGCEVRRMLPGDEHWPAYVELTNNAVIGTDLVVSATGVVPNVEVMSLGNPELRLAEDGGILVDDHMRSSVAGVYAAGDSCTAGWVLAKHWFQMRLWTQARQMGAYAARCMAADQDGEDILQDFCFEMFTHVTRFFGYKVILLGLHNAQGLGTDCEFMLRATKGKEYVKLVLQGGRVQGAVLIGDTELEETCENLILDQVDVSHLGEDLLNPHVDVEDYFD